MSLSRREFFKSIGMMIGTFAVSKIPLHIPDQLPYWKDLMVAGETYRVVFQWDRNYGDHLMVNGVDCDPGEDIFHVTTNRATLRKEPYD